MKILLLGVNAKYIHSNLAIRLLYQSLKQDQIVSEMVEVTIKDRISDIRFLCEQYDVVAIGVYIWNATFVKELVSQLKNPKIILGGPEVTYETQTGIEAYRYDYLIKGSGELSINQVIQHIQEGTSLPEYVQTPTKCATQIFAVDLNYVMQLDSPYRLFTAHDFATRIIYFEASRGCPFICSYCLSSLEEKVVLYDQVYLEKQLSYVLKRAKTVKFLDRTFNLNDNFVSFIMDMIKKYANKQQSIQFECKAELLTSQMIDIFAGMNEYQIRFEIGIQSTDDTVNRCVDRVQDFEKVRSRILEIQSQTSIDLHLDLIAGLPYESLARFRQTFNEVAKLDPSELQLGILKMLKGTKLTSQAQEFAYVYQESPPYEIIKNAWLSESELDVIRDVERMVELFWNHSHLQDVMAYQLSRVDDYFTFLWRLSQFISDLDVRQYHERTHALYSYLDIMHMLDQTSISLLVDAYYMHFKVKPKPLLSLKQKHLKRILVENDEFMLNNKIKNEILYKYGCVESYRFNGIRYLCLYIYIDHHVKPYYLEIKE